MNTLITITREETKGAKLADVILYAIGKVMDFKNAHMRVHVPEGDKYMEFDIIIGYEHLGSQSRFNYFYRSYYTNDDGEACFCDSTDDHFDYASEMRNVIKMECHQGDRYDRIDIIEGKAPICTHP